MDRDVNLEAKGNKIQLLELMKRAGVPGAEILALMTYVANRDFWSLASTSGNDALTAAKDLLLPGLDILEGLFGGAGCGLQAVAGLVGGGRARADGHDGCRIHGHGKDRLSADPV